jgi:hypothetical protein
MQGWPTIALGSALLLAGCDRYNHQSSAASELVKAQQVPDHWVIVPAESAGVGAAPAVWRLNSKTGTLEYCWRYQAIKCDEPFPPQATDPVQSLANGKPQN